MQVEYYLFTEEVREGGCPQAGGAPAVVSLTPKMRSPPNSIDIITNSISHWHKIFFVLILGMAFEW